MKAKKNSLAAELAKTNPKPTENSLAEFFAKENYRISNTSSGKLATALAKTRQNSKSV